MDSIETYVDTDYAGCKVTRKSTTGGIAKLSKHVIKGWSNTQSIVTLSSGESEYYGLVRGSSVAIGTRSILQDLGLKLGVVVYSDASAALGIAQRRGVGKVRHVEVHQLWLQDRVARGDIKVRKIEGKKNPADAVTKYVDGVKLKEHCDRVDLRIWEGRHSIAPILD